MVVRPHRHGDRERVDARRGDRRGRGDGARAPRDEVASRRSTSPTTCSRRRSRRHAHARRPIGVTVATGPGAGSPRRPRSPCCCSIRARTARSRDSRRSPRRCAARGLRDRRLRPPRADAARAAGEWGAGRGRRVGAALRRADGLRRPARRVLAATRDEFKRSMPGRLVGVTVDSHVATRLPARAADARAAHPAREATSNICTAQVLLAVIASMYAVYHGPGRPRADRASRAPARRDPDRRGSGALGALVVARVLRHDRRRHRRGTRAVRDAGARARDEPARGRLPALGRRVARQTTTAADVERPPSPCSPAAARSRASPTSTRGGRRRPCPALVRRSPFLTHPVFARHRSETGMLRYTCAASPTATSRSTGR